ncbi:MAG: YggT family protein [Rhodocyclaceae bacterium]
MLIQVFIYLLQTVVGFFTMMLLVRTVMRWMRISFINQVGQFVLATTNWAVLPAQRILPTIGKLDTSALVPAWLLQVLQALLISVLMGYSLANPAAVAVRALIAGSMGLISSALYLLLFALILSAIISWVNPYSPIAPTLNLLTRPFLDPIRKFIPPVANVDLSPMILSVFIWGLLLFVFGG